MQDRGSINASNGITLCSHCGDVPDYHEYGKFDTDVQLLELPIHCHSLSSLITQTCWKWG